MTKDSTPAFSAAVPTVWQMLLTHLRETNGRLTSLKRVVIGGSAVPEAIVRGFRGGVGLFAQKPVSEPAKARIDEDGLDDPIEPSGPSCNAEMPRSIRFKVEDTGDDVLFSYKEAKWNPPILPGSFTQPTPDGVRKIYVDCKKGGIAEN